MQADGPALGVAVQGQDRLVADLEAERRRPSPALRRRPAADAPPARRPPSRPSASGRAGGRGRPVRSSSAGACGRPGRQAGPGRRGPNGTSTIEVSSSTAARCAGRTVPPERPAPRGRSGRSTPARPAGAPVRRRSRDGMPRRARGEMEPERRRVLVEQVEGQPGGRRLGPVEPLPHGHRLAVARRCGHQGYPAARRQQAQEPGSFDHARR